MSEQVTMPPGFVRAQVRTIFPLSAFIGLLLGIFPSLSETSLTPLVIFFSGSLIYGVAFFCVTTWVMPWVGASTRGRKIAWQFAVAVMAMSAASFCAVNVVLYANFGIWLLSRTPDGSLITPVSLLYFGLPVLPVAAMAVFEFDQTWTRMKQDDDRVKEAQELAASAQLDALRAQINPHFLFNSLNSISQLISTDPQRAEECVQRLAEIFRYLLQSKERTLVTFSQELAIADGYLDIERARFGKLLDVELEIGREARSWLVPCLFLQPLVENAVRHGVSKKIGGGQVRVEAQVTGGELSVVVADTGVGMTNGVSHSVAGGVGLKNVRERLLHLYGEGYEPAIESAIGEGTRVTVRVPAQTSDGTA